MYYPLSQITTNLYTNGGEYVIASSKAPYSGYYWKNSKGEYFTGKTPQDVPVEKLVLITNDNLISVSNELNIVSYYNEIDSDSINYLNLTKPNKPGLPPIYSPNIPIQQDYKTGEYRRYFCKKINELIYLEINRDDFNKLINQDSTIQFQYYIPFNIPWQLIGDKTQVYITNKNVTELTMKQKALPQFDLYLQKDYTKYHTV